MSLKLKLNSCKANNPTGLDCSGRLSHRQDSSTRPICLHTANVSTHKTTFFTKFMVFLLFGLIALVPVQSQDVTTPSSSSTDTRIRVEQNYTLHTSLSFLECLKRMDNTKQATFICSDHPDMLPALIYAEEWGKEICQESFAKDSWNCSGFSILKEPKVTQGAVYRESAYVYGLSLAVISHTIANACTQGLLKSCTCTEGPTESNENGDKRRLCLDHMDYGLNITKEFLGYRYHGRGYDLKSELIEHNFAAAEKIIRDFVSDTPIICKCHGVSGSCSVKTCHSDLPDFSKVAQKLKKMYYSACQVKPNGHSTNTWIPSQPENCNDFTDEDFIFRDDFDFCAINFYTGAPGVQGRVCDIRGGDAPDSCKNLCRACGRRTLVRTVRVPVERECSFHFCCNIRCEQFVEERVEHYCS